MRGILLFFLVFIYATSFSQDIIVLRQGETELKCRIIELNDTAIFYKKWETPGSAKYFIKRNEVQSYTLEKNYKKIHLDANPNGSALIGSKNVDLKARNLEKNKSKEDPESGFLGQYHSESVQKGFLILANGDSITGNIVVKNVAQNQLMVTFRDEEGTQKIYQPSELKKYSYADLVYDFVKTDFTKDIINNQKPKNGNLLLDREVNGTAKLYRMYILTFSKNAYANYPDPPSYLGKLKRWYVIDNGRGQVQIMQGHGLRKKIMKLFNDDEVINTTFSEKAPKFKDLEKFVRDYNSRH